MNGTVQNKLADHQEDGGNIGNRDHENATAARPDTSLRESANSEKNPRFDEWWREYERKMGAGLEFGAEVAA